METLESGSEPTVRGPRWRWGVSLAAALVIALGAIAWGVEARWHSTATTDLAAAFDRTLSAIEISERRVQSVMEYARPARERADVDPAVRDSLDALVREAAVDAAADIAVPRDALDQLALPPWRPDLQDARDQARMWLDLRAAGITSLAQTGRVTYPSRDELDSVRESLRVAWERVRAD